MIPSLAALGGTLGLLGLREPELVGDDYLANLNRGFQRHIDSCPVDYAALMRDPASGQVDTPIATLLGNPPSDKARVVLVGGGIANIIAAYELARIGIHCTVLEETSRLGGRLVSYQQTANSTGWSEAGANRFPRGGLMWHYVARWVEAQGFDPVNDPIQAASFPSPGTVPTMFAYQGETYDWSPTLDDLPPIVREARALFADFIGNLNNGVSDPGTVYFADAVRALKAEPDSETTFHLKTFWESMLKQYDGRSFAEVLQTEIFTNGSNLRGLMAAFRTVGVGTGGFGHLYEAAFLEVLRVLLWDISEEFMVPEQDTYPKLFGPDDGGTWGFAMGLARAAVHEAQKFYPGITLDDMFKGNSRVVSITDVEGSAGLFVNVQPPGKSVLVDYVIVGMTSRAMQHLQLDLPYAGNPFLVPLPPPPNPSVTDLVRPSCQAAIKRLDVVSGYRMNTELIAPRFFDPWPEDSADDKILCFVTDERARLAYVLPEVPPTRGVVRVTAVDAYGAGADKFSPLMPWMQEEAAADSFAYGLHPGGNGGDGAADPVAGLLRRSEMNGFDWGLAPTYQGAFKVDKPEDNYFSSSLFYHYQLAHPTNVPLQGTDIFLSGDSVGHLGGWVEGAAMSAINAVVGICSRMEQRNPGTLRLEDRFAALLESDVRLFHRWVSISGRAPRKSGLSTMARLGNWENDPALPPKWRYLGKTTGQAFEMVTVSKPGDFLVAVVDGQLRFNTRGNPDDSWQDLHRVPGTEDFVPVRSISVATEGGPQAQLIIVANDGLLWHGTHDAGGWSQFTRPWGDMKFKQAALDVEAGNAQVVAVDDSDRLGHGIRLTDGTWSPFRYPPSPGGDPPFFVLGAADSCTSADKDLTTIAAIDRQTGSVHVAIRDGQHGQHGIWGAWVELPSPRPPDAEEPLRAVKVRVVVLDDFNHAQVWALFTDGSTTPNRLYSSVRDTANPSGLRWTTFQPVPYPLSGAAGPIVDFAPTLPHNSRMERDLPSLSTVVYAQIGANLEADQPDEDEVSETP